jgi:parallel beta-helix repeat protein
MADVIVRVINNRAVVQVAGAEALVRLAEAATRENAERAEEALAQIEQIAAGAPDAPSVLNKLDKTENLSELADVAAARQNLSLNEVSPLDYGAVGNGIDADDMPIALAIAAALATGRSVNLRGLAYGVSAPVVLESGVSILNGALVARSDFDGFWIIQYAGTNITVRGVAIDGANLPSESIVSGARAQGSTVNLLIENCLVKNLSFDGISIAAAGGLYSHAYPTVRGCRIENVGWGGISMEDATDGLILGNTVYRSAYHGIAVARSCRRVRITANSVDRSMPPDIIYDGPGSVGGVEGGFLCYKEPLCAEITISANTFEDNRNAGQDGIGVGEDGTEHGSWAITGNVVRYAGLFGIDPVGNCTCSGNLIEFAAEQGIHVGLDLGGMMRNITVTGNTIKNTGLSAGKAGILVGDTLGASCTARNIKIADNMVIDDRATKYTDYGIIIVAEAGETTIEGLSVTGNDLARVGVSSFLHVGASGPGADFQCWGNNTLGDERTAFMPSVTSASGTISAVSASGRFHRVGSTVHFRCRIQITSAGTGTGVMTVALPVPARSGTSFPLYGVAGNLAVPLYVLAQGSDMVVVQPGGGTVIASGADLYLSGTYEAS